MTADEIFAKLGFKKSSNQVQVIYEKTEELDYGKANVSIVFWIPTQSVSITCEEDDEPTNEVFLSRICAEAIAMKGKELCWR